MMVDFYYSIGSRYSYLASTQIAALEKETGCRVAWYPVNSCMNNIVSAICLQYAAASGILFSTAVCDTDVRINAIL